ncbi:acyltransferase [uncultured Prevotella sp.]|uniref:acyltransferase family protein n=1 Tax=uncultured Prevotella sp. TaxID=159272 RepID=UPI0026349D8B|nr:acyltransferase [uncultured Prevotella sp.]
MNKIISAKSSSHHIATLQSMRFVFCMQIFICHYFRSLGFHGFDYGGDAGVTFFFILSGFVLSIGCGPRVEDGTFRYVQFLRKRLAKIYPLHLVTFTIALCMSFAAGVKFNITKTLLHVFMLQEFTLSEDMLKYGTGLSWFLGALFFCYLLFPFLYRQLTISRNRVFGALLTIYILLALAIESCCNNSAIDDFVYAFPPLRIIDFAIGIIAYRLYTAHFSIRIRQWIARRSTCILSTLEIIIVAMSVLTYIPYCSLPSWIRFAPYFWIPFSLLIYWFAISSDNKGIISKLLNQRALVFLGNISFEIYMLHGIVITAFVFVWGRLFGYDTVCNPILFAICLVLSVVAAYIFAIIMRIGRYKNNRLQKKA